MSFGKLLANRRILDALHLVYSLLKKLMDISRVISNYYVIC